MLMEHILCARLCSRPLTSTDSLTCPPAHPISLRTVHWTHFTDEQTDFPQYSFSLLPL